MLQSGTISFLIGLTISCIGTPTIALYLMHKFGWTNRKIAYGFIIGILASATLSVVVVTFLSLTHVI
jgi:hypothetical protein